MPKYYDPGYTQISAPLGSEEISPVRDIANGADKSITLTVLRNWIQTGYTPAPPANAQLLGSSNSSTFLSISLGNGLSLSGSTLGFSGSVPSIQIGNRTFITEIGGNTWLTANAHWDGSNWQRINIAQTAFAINFQSNDNIPFEANTKGMLIWRAVPGANPIGTNFGAVGGWELIQGVTEYKDWVCGGFALEVDGNGTFPYGRLVHASIDSGATTWTGIVKNIFGNLAAADDNTKPIWFCGIKNDSFVVSRGAAGQTTSAGLQTLMSVDASGNFTIAGTGLPTPPASAPLLGSTAGSTFRTISLGTNLSLSGTTLNAAGPPVSAALLGSTAGAAFQAITLGTNLTLSGTTLNAASGGSSPPASAQLLGSTSGSAFQAITLGTNLSLSGTTLNAAGGGGSTSTISSSTQTASYTLALADAGTVVEMNVASANTVTIPPNSSVAFPVGTILEICQVALGQTTVAAGAGVTIRNPGTSLAARAQWSTLSLRQRATNEWVLGGDMA